MKIRRFIRLVAGPARWGNTRGRWVAMAGLALLAIVAAFALIPGASFLVLREPLDTELIPSETGFAYTWNRPGTTLDFADSEGRERSRLALYENDRPLGPTHAPHADIRALGGGRFSYWNHTLLFSSSDNSDPRLNGRRYVVRYPWIPPKWLALVMAIVVFWINALRIRRLLLSDRLPVFSIGLGVIPLLFPLMINGLPLNYAVSVRWGDAGLSRGVMRRVHSDDLLPAYLVLRQDSGVAAGKSVSSPLQGAEKPWRLGRFSLSSGGPRVSVGNNLLTVMRASYLDQTPPENHGLVIGRVLYFHLSDSDEAGFRQGRMKMDLPIAFDLSVSRIILFHSFMVFVVALIVAHARGRPSLIKALSGYLALLGVVLMGANALGLLLDLRGKDVRGDHGPNDLTLSYKEARRQLVRAPSETGLAYAIRANSIINKGVAHYWRDEGLNAYRIRVPIWENWILYGRSFLDRRYKRYQFVDPHKALERGVGLCGQQSMILIGFLRKAGIDAHIVNLGGPTVVTAEVSPGVWHILDPDFGVWIPRSLAELETSPALAVNSYRSLFQSMALDEVTILHHYGPAGNSVDLTGLTNYVGGQRYVDFEEQSYKLKHTIPLGLLGGAVLLAIFSQGLRR